MLSTHHLSYVFPPSALVPIVLSTFLAEHVTGQFQTSNSGCILLDGSSLAFHSSQHVEDIPHWCAFVKDLVRDVLVGWVLKHMSSLYLTHWPPKDMCRQWFSSPTCQTVTGVIQTSTPKVNQQCWKELAGWCA